MKTEKGKTIKARSNLWWRRTDSKFNFHEGYLQDGKRTNSNLKLNGTTDKPSLELIPKKKKQIN